MPFGLGFHPAFVWPLPDAQEKPHKIRLDNGAEPSLARLQAGLLLTGRLPSPFSGGEIVLDHKLFEADAMIFPDSAGRACPMAWRAAPH